MKISRHHKYLDPTISIKFGAQRSLKLHTPVTNERICAIGAFVVRNGINISISPSTRLDYFILIICRLDLKLLQKPRSRHFERWRSVVERIKPVEEGEMEHSKLSTPLCIFSRRPFSTAVDRRAGTCRLSRGTIVGNNQPEIWIVLV